MTVTLVSCLVGAALSAGLPQMQVSTADAVGPAPRVALAIPMLLPGGAGLP